MVFSTSEIPSATPAVTYTYDDATVAYGKGAPDESGEHECDDELSQLRCTGACEAEQPGDGGAKRIPSRMATI